MKKSILILTLTTGTLVNVSAQQALSTGGVTPTTPTTINPTGFSQFEASGGAITQNFYSGSPTPPAGQETGNFDPTARWNTMGSLKVAPTAIVNGYRTQTDGRALTTGYITSFVNPPGSTLNPALSDPFVQWIGNANVSSTITPGNLRFRFAANPTGGSSTPIFTMAPATTSGGGITTPSFNYADSNAFVGQKQSGTFGSFGASDIWSATGQLDIPGVLTTYGSRHQYKEVTVNLGHIEIPGTPTKVKSVLDFGSALPAGAASTTGIFQFRTFTNPNSSSSIKNIWQSNNNYGNMVFGRQDYGSVSSSSFYVSVFDGLTSAASATALSFVERAGLYVTGDGVDQNTNNQLNSYAAVVGDVSGVTLVNNGRKKYAILGIADPNYTLPNTSNATFAGCFIGDVLYTGNLIPASDQKFKKDVNKEENIMPKLMQLQPKNYFFDVEKYKNMAFSNRLQHGLISQEVEKVFPELVVDAFGPNTSSDKKEDAKPIPYKGA